ncbi:MAG: TRAP transporter fused permease subunit [Candidatus Bathyarchaeia archaeon]
MASSGRSAAVAAIAISWSLIQLYYGYTRAFDYLQILPIHLYSAMALAFLLKPISKIPGKCALILDYSLAALSMICGAYFLWEFERISTRIPFFSPVAPLDFVFGVITIALLLEAGRRALGSILPMLGIFAILFSLFGQYLPGLLGHRALSCAELIEFMYLTQEGIFGIPLRVSATFVFMFILFGAFLQKTGLGDFYFDLANAAVGRFRGGPGKVPVIASSLFGTISGSAVANVAVDGPITINMMKRSGYRAHQAAAIEALASTGGQIMPPVMGAAAFLMAQIMMVRYWDVVVAAILPAVLYYVALYIVLDVEAVRLGLGRSRIKTDLRSLLARSYMVGPLFILVYLLSLGYSETLSAFIGVISAVAIAILPILARRRIGDLRMIPEALIDGAKASVEVAIPCAIAGIIVGTLILTGLGLKLTNIMIEASGGNLPILLVLVMLVCLILGMGMPTTAAYITVAALAIPSLIRMGVIPMAAHMFGFFFAVLSMVTPPVALAAYTAAGIAGCKCNEVGWQAFKYAIPMFVIPFYFVQHPQLLMIGSPSEIAFYFIKAIIIITSVSIALMGHAFTEIQKPARLAFLASAAMAFVPDPITDSLSAVLFALLLALDWGRRKRAKVARSPRPSPAL